MFRVEVHPRSPLAGKLISELGLKTRKVQVLSIRRRREIITVPRGSAVVLAGDEIICYGSEDAAAALFSAEDRSPDNEPAGPPGP